MGNLFLYELKKLFCKKRTWVLILIFLVGNCAIFYQNIQITSPYSPESYQHLYQDSMGKEPARLEKDWTMRLALLQELSTAQNAFLSDDQLVELKERWGEEGLALLLDKQADGKGLTAYTGSPGAEYALYQDALRQLTSVIGYAGYLQEVQTKAKNLAAISIFQKGDNSFELKNIEKTARDFLKMEKADPPVFSPDRGVEAAVSFSFTDILLLLLLLYLCYETMIREKENGSLFLIRSTQRGRTALITAKIGVLFVSCAFLTGMLFLGNLCIGQFTYGLGDLSRSIQSISSFKTSILEGSVLQFFFLFFVSKLFVLFLCTCLLLLLSYRVRQSLFVYLGVFLLYGIGAAQYYTIDSTSYLQFWKYANLFYFLKSESVLGQYQNINLFGVPVNAIPFVFISCAILLLLMAAATILIFCRSPILQARKKRISFPGMRGLHTGLFRHESYKLYVTQLGLLLIFVIGLYQYVSYKDYRPLLIQDDILYQSLLLRAGGELTADTPIQIEKEWQRISSLEQESFSLEQAFQNKEVSHTEYQIHSMNLAQKLADKPALEQLEQRYSELAALQDRTGFSLSLIFEKEYDLLTKRMDQDVSQAMLFLAAMLLTLTGYFTMEQSSGMNRLIQCSASGGSRIHRTKLLVGCGMGLLLFIAAYLPGFLVTKKHFNLNTLSAALQSLKQFAHISFQITIGQYLILQMCLRLLSSILFVMLWYSLCQVFKKTVPALLAGSVLWLSPCILYFFQVHFFTDFSSIPLLSTNYLFLHPEAIPVGVSALYLLASVASVFALTRRQTRRLR